MTASKAIGSGLGAASRAKFLVFIFFACNLLLAAALAAPMHDAIAAHLGNSKMGEELLRGLSSAWLNEFNLANQQFMKAFSTALIYGAVLFLALNTILSAGAFEVFVQGEGAGMHAFGRGVGKYFARFVRLAIVASFLYFVAFLFWNGAISGLMRSWFRNSAQEGTEYYLLWLHDALLVLTLLVVNAMVDYAKADMILDQHRSALAALGHGAGFVLRNLGTVMAIYVGIGVLGVAAMFLYAVFARYFPQGSVATILVWFVVAQVFLWLRWMFRLASWGAAVSFYRSHLPIRVAEPEPQPAVGAARA